MQEAWKKRIEAERIEAERRLVRALKEKLKLEAAMARLSSVAAEVYRLPHNVGDALPRHADRDRTLL